MIERFSSGTLLAFGLSMVGVCYLIRKYASGGRCHSKARLDGKTVIVTGANTGIGKETAVDLAGRGAIVVMACRDQKRGESAVEDVRKRSGSSNVFLEILDLASLASIHKFAASFLSEYDKLHILINNAGIMCPQMKTEDGFEMQIGVNHFGHFALTNLLLERMVESSPSRIINVSSYAHKGIGFTKAKIHFDDINLEKNYKFTVAYCQSKLANVLFTKELSKKIADTDVTTFAVHPGVIITKLQRHSPMFQFVSFFIGWLFFKTPEEGAQTQIYCAVQDGIENKSGLYFSDCNVAKSSELSCDDGIAKKLWELSEEMTRVKFPL